MKVYSILALACIGLILPNYSVALPNLNDRKCRSCDDPHMTTFDGLHYEFQHVGDNFVMFLDTAHNISVTTGYRPCNQPSAPPSCNCAVSVQYQGLRLVFDVCGIKGTPRDATNTFGTGNLEFYYVDAATTTVAICNTLIPAGDETNDAFWDGPTLPNSLIKCGKLATSNSYMLRTNDPNNDNNIYVELNLHDAGISCVNIRPSANVYNNGNARGLCGNFDDDTTNEFVGPNGAAVTEAGMTAWQLSRGSPFPELKLNNRDCPNDPVGATTPQFGCANLRSQYFAGLYGLPAVLQAWIRSGQREKPQQGGEEVCKAFFEKGKVIEALNKNLITQEQFDTIFKLCIQDFVASLGDLFWVINQAQIAQNWALETCIKENPLCVEFAKRDAKCSFKDQYTALVGKRDAMKLLANCN